MQQQQTTIIKAKRKIQKASEKGTEVRLRNFVNTDVANKLFINQIARKIADC